MEKPVIGNGRQKVWYLILALFFIWFLLLCIYFSGLKRDRDQVAPLRRNDENFEDTHESDSVKVPDNRNDMIVKGKDEVAESVVDVDGMDKVNPIDNFFIGGDWDKYIDEISKEDNKKSETDGQKQIMMYEGRSISNDLGKGNDEKMDNILTNKVDDDNVGDSISVKGDMIKEVNRLTGKEDWEEIESNTASDYESCSGRYIYIHDLPRQFNEDLLKHCRSLNEWYNMCPFISNFGLGPKIKNSEKVLLHTGWFETNQFMLEVIFHNRMKQYNCLTKNSSLASAIFVPYYAGLDVARYLWRSSRLMRDHYSLNLVKWLKERPEWKKMWGWDHFLVAGRITWDFRRLTDENSDWGNKLMVVPESRNMTMLTIESSPWHGNDFAIPYPTYFHPSSDDDVFQWQNKVRGMKRRFLFSFAGASRPNTTDSIRTEIFKQCKAARRKCKLLECAPGSKKCYNPINLIKMFQSSMFCLQPPGDSLTRRSIFDSVLAGCIPVFFHPGSAYVQYLWHLPKDYTEYSVFIPANKVKREKSIIGRTLSRIPKGKILAMRERVIKLIPSMVYADPRSSLESLEDAFDITIDGVLQRIEKIRKDTKEGKNVSESEANGEEFTWKKSLFGTVGKHEWDPFFERT